MSLPFSFRSYPANERTHYKHAVHQHFSHRNEPLTKKDITQALRQMNGQKGEMNHEKKINRYFAGILSIVVLLTACGGNGKDQGKQQQTVIVGVYGGDWEKEYQTNP